MAVKRRTIWLTDEEWATLNKVAQDRGDTVSAVIRDFWTIAADPRPAAAAYLNPTVPYGGPTFNTQPFTPVPKKGR